MPRSSRHKSSKHSSREARDYSDSEKDSNVKDRKSKEESSARVSKESSSGEKRKLALKDKDSFAIGNGEYAEEYSSSKRRKERVDDSVNDRWNGGEDDRGEATRKLKEKSSDSRSKRRDGSLGAYGEGEDVVKKSSGKSEGKHRDSSSRRESRDGGAERERERDRDREKERDREREKKGKESKDVKGERLVDVDDQSLSKQVSDKTDSNTHNLLQSPDSDNQLDRRIRRKRDGSGDGDRHPDSVGDVIGKQLSSKEYATKDVRLKDDKHKDERFRGKYHEDADRENRHGEDKQREERASRDRTNNRSDEKHMKDDKDTIEIRQKKSVPPDGDQDHDRDFDIGRDGNWDREYYHRDREREPDRDRERDRDWDHLHDRDHDRDWDLDREWDKEREQERDRVRDRDRNADYDKAYLDDRSSRYKDSRGKKRSPDDFDDYDDVKHKGVRNSADIEKKSSSKAEADADRGRSQTRQSHVDNISNSRRRLSPNSSSHGGSDDYRSSKAEDLKYRDSPAEQRTQTTSSREVTGFSSERVSKYRSLEKPIKMDDGNLGELSVERSSSSKASPKGLADRSSSSSLERRYRNRNAVRWSLEIEESGRRSRDSMGARDLPSTEDRSSREMPLDESMPSDTSFYNRSSQSNSALIPPSSFRGGVGSPSFMGSVEEDGRVNSGGRYKRGGDPIPGRGQGNAWRGAQNWSSPVPNGYIPFQHGPSHGGFQAMMPPPLFGVRPSTDMNHSGIPYHMPDADRFSGHLRPLGWQNMMDGSGPAHMHGWDGNNGVYRDEAHFYGGPEWDQNRHPINGRGWETGADLWKGQNRDLPSTPLKEDATVHALPDDISVGQTGQRSQKENNNNNNGVNGKDTETKPAITSIKESAKISLKTPNEKMLDPSTLSSDDNVVNVSCAYLSKLDISEELVSPELYKQGISLLNKEEKTTDGEDTAMLVNLKDGARVIAKSSSTLWSSSRFPVTNNSVFQKALNIYKKQRICFNCLPIVNGEIIDVILASNMDEVPNSDVDKIEESNLRSGNVEMPDAALPDIDEKAEAARDMDEKSGAVPVTATHERPEEMVLDPGGNSDDNVDTPHVKSELPDEACSRNSLKVVQDDSQDKVDGILPQMVILGNSQDDPMTDTDNVAQTASVLPTNEQGVEDIAEMKGNDSFASSGEGKGSGDALSGPLIFSDGSPNASGTLMPESNESESVILSRIHHSPESTH